jgi:hypothetical protein
VCGDVLTGWPGRSIPEARLAASDEGELDWAAAFPDAMAAGGFDVVVGNPPYVPLARAPRLEAFRTSGCGNLYAPVVERAVQALRPDGGLGMVVPVSAVSGPKYRPLLECLSRFDCWISTYSNRPGKLFPVEQRLAILRACPGEGSLRMSAYQHWYVEERPHLFARLTYHPASCWPETGMPIKSGGPLPETLFRRMQEPAGRLGDLVGPGEGTVWLHDGPTYWVRALPFKPQVAGGQASHFHRISTPGRDTAYLLSAILGSSFFYFFFKMVSNCRDLGPREWRQFPVPVLSGVAQEALAALGRRVGDRLQATAARRTRVYPGGPVEYFEYYPARAKDLLDEIDRLLGAGYGATAAELDYIRGYDLKYRMGRNAGEET